MTAARKPKQDIAPGPAPTFQSDGPSSAPKVIFALVSLLILLQVLDWHSTFLAISQGRTEQNKLIVMLSNKIGIHGAVSVFKIIAIILSATYLICSNKKKTIFTTISLVVIIIPYIAVVINNYSY